MNSKEYTLPNGKKAVFEYDMFGIGTISLECMDELMAMIADRPQGWIPCSERLPSNFNEDEAVLATTDVDGRRVMLMLAVDVERFYLKGYVSAWMPSPQPWKGSDDDL